VASDSSFERFKDDDPPTLPGFGFLQRLHSVRDAQLMFPHCGSPHFQSSGGTTLFSASPSGLGFLQRLHSVRDAQLMFPQSAHIQSWGGTKLFSASPSGFGF
jgi:hypothetical protein